MVLERPAESIYAAIPSVLTCSTRRQCFENEIPNRIEKEYGERLKRMPNEYDPKEWGWDITSLVKGSPKLLLIYIS